MRQLTKLNKKIYFNDPFIYAVAEAWLTGKPRQNFDYLDNPIVTSQIIENLVYLKMKNDFEDVFFHRSNGEIDFVCEDYLLEVKHTNKISPEDFKHLKSFTNKKIMVTKSTLDVQKDILLIPIEIFLMT